MNLSIIFKEFFSSKKTEGFALIAATLFSLIVTNYFLGESYVHFWHTEVLGLPLEHWINDGLMTIFFLLVGLELERELYIGELSDIKNALLPILAAVGGIIAPACIHLAFNYGTPTQGGAGIPMATDIAFSLGILSLLGKRVPLSLKIFLTALAIADDLGAILVIAFFYTKTILWTNIFIALGIYIVLLLMGRFKVYKLWPYIIGGIAMWYFMLHSGVHATITGVLLAFAIPFGEKGEKSLSYNLQHFLHKPVAFFILPLFAIANTCILLDGNWIDGLGTSNSVGIFFGLVLGKPLGILLVSFIAIKLKVCSLPEGVKWVHLTGASILAGIGFTMSIFVSLLAFENPEWIKFSQIVVLFASLTAACLGALWFLITVKPIK